MIVNAFSVVAAFAAVLRTVLGLVIVAAGARAIREARRAPGTADARLHLLLAACSTLLGLAVVSWPLLYLVLESYVPSNGGPDWPEVMCVEGVSRIGTGSEGAAAWLPRLLAILAVTKPLLVFASGAWLVLHLLHRRRRTDAMLARVVAALGLAGLLAVADGAAETAYLTIPKQEKALAAGCCATPPPTRVPEAPPVGGPAVTAAFLGVGAAVVLALTAAIRRGGRWLAAAALLALVSVPVGFLFLEGVAAPRFLRLPYHPCVFCLARRMPETLVGIGLYAAGAFGVGWALVARMGGGTGEGLLRTARFGYLGALVMASVMLVNA